MHSVRQTEGQASFRITVPQRVVDPSYGSAVKAKVADNGDVVVSLNENEARLLSLVLLACPKRWRMSNPIVQAFAKMITDCRDHGERIWELRQ